MTSVQKKAAKMIDQTLLSPVSTEDEVIAFCEEAKKYGFASVCINPVFVRTASSVLGSSQTKTCTVIDFPLGAESAGTKSYQASSAIASGADEVDIVVSLSLVKAHKYRALRTELRRIMRTVRKAEAHRPLSEQKSPVLAKLILETCYLTDDEIIETCLAAQKAGFDFVKTSTGFAKGGATVHAVSLMAETVGNTMGVKASGGIRDAKTFKEMLEAGATRIGTSHGVKIISEL